MSRSGTNAYLTKWGLFGNHNNASTRRETIGKYHVAEDKFDMQESFSLSHVGVTSDLLYNAATGARPDEAGEQVGETRSSPDDHPQTQKKSSTTETPVRYPFVFTHPSRPIKPR